VQVHWSVGNIVSCSCCLSVGGADATAACLRQRRQVQGRRTGEARRLHGFCQSRCTIDKEARVGSDRMPALTLLPVRLVPPNGSPKVISLGADVRALSAEYHERRRPAGGARHRHQPRDSALLVEQVRSAVRGGHPPAAGQPDSTSRSRAAARSLWRNGLASCGKPRSRSPPA